MKGDPVGLPFIILIVPFVIMRWFNVVQWSIFEGMNKPTILIGSRSTGKSRLSEIMIKGRRSVVLQGGGAINSTGFPFHVVSPDVEVLVIDDLSLNMSSIELLNSFINGKTINRKGMGPFRWHGQVIGIFNTTMEEFSLLDPSISNNFNIFELKSCK